MRQVAILTAVAAIAPLSILGVVLTAASVWEGVTMAVGYVLTLGVLREWSLDGYPRRAVLALMFTMAAWAVGAVTASSPISFVPLSLVGALLLARMARRRLSVLLFALGVGGIGGSAFLVHPLTWELAGMYLVLPVVGSLFVAEVVLISERAWMVVRQLERARDAEAELAAAQERVRLAGDLHDLQGQSLHLIKLKATLAQRILRDGTAPVAAELEDIRHLADEAIVQARALASDHRSVHLRTEAENARRLGEAAGIAVTVRHDDGDPEATHPLLGQVLREATTNLLRHAQPREVTITTSRGLVRVWNDGAPEGAGAPLNGLARLRDRLEDAGGTLELERAAGEFSVTARLAPVLADDAREDAR